MIECGAIHITSAGDAIAAQIDLVTAGGELSLPSGGGSRSQIGDDTCAKGIKGVVRVNLAAGTLAIDSAPDAIHSSGSASIREGTFVLATGS